MNHGPPRWSGESASSLPPPRTGARTKDRHNRDSSPPIPRKCLPSWTAVAERSADTAMPRGLDLQVVDPFTTPGRSSHPSGNAAALPHAVHDAIPTLCRGIGANACRRGRRWQSEAPTPLCRGASTCKSSIHSPRPAEVRTRPVTRRLCRTQSTTLSREMKMPIRLPRCCQVKHSALAATAQMS